MPAARILLQLSRDSLLHVNTIYHSQWRNWRGTEGRIAPWQAKCKNRPPTLLIFRFKHSFGFQ